MTSILREIAADIHSGLQSVQRIEALLEMLVRICGIGFLFVWVGLVILILKRKR
jgi:hypothetical protein